MSRRKVHVTKHNQANWQAQGFYPFCPRVRIVQLSSRRPPELVAGTARMHEETVIMYRKKEGDAFTADQKVVNEENESRLQHRYAGVVQDLYSHWISSYL